MDEADRSGDVWQNYSDEGELSINNNLKVEVPDSQAESSFSMQRKPNTIGAQYAQWQEPLVDIREWLNSSVGEDWTDKGLEWIEPSQLTLAKEQKVDLEPFHDLPIRENLTISQAHQRLGLALLEAWKDDAGKARVKEELKK
jgi:hypothetical protein